MPEQEQCSYIAHSKDYIVVIHFSERIGNLVLSETVTNQSIQNLYNAFKMENRANMDLKDIKGLDVDKATATLNIQKKGSVMKGLGGFTDFGGSKGKANAKKSGLQGSL